MNQSLLRHKAGSVSYALMHGLVFLYFIFSSGELLHFVVGMYKPKVGHMVALILLGLMLKWQKLWKLDRHIVRASMCILASLTLSAVGGAAPLRSLGYVGVYLFNFILYFLIPLQLMQWMPLGHFFRNYWSAFVALGLYAGLQLFLSVFEIYDPRAMQRIGSIARGQAWTYEPSYYALYITPYVMYHNAAAFLREEAAGSFKRRLKLGAQNAFLIASTSTGMMFSYPIFFIATLLKPLNFFQKVTRRKMKTALLSFSFSLLTLTILFYELALQSIFKFFYFGFQVHHSFAARWEGIVASVQIFLKHPILGSGLGGVSSERFQEQSVYDFKMETLNEFEAFDPTNCLTEILASLGIVGFLAFAYLCRVFYRAYQVVIRDRSLEIEKKKMATALFLSLVVMIVTLQMNSGLFRPYVWIHAAVVYGYLYHLQQRGVEA